ncbi:MAG: xanthine dehydrogenase family protein [Anaerolineaceae bacterium]|nr:xanthine dehydrogenase family protein [Anaerolineaceae bacterium]
MSNSVGASRNRVDEYEKVTGQARFVADLSLGRILHARVVRSDHAHARLLSVETSADRALPGVKAVVTGAACSRRMGSAIADQYPIARDKVRFWGEPVAVVVAASDDIAEKATALVQVTYELLPPLLHPRQSVETGAPRLHPELENNTHDANLHPQPGSNIAHHNHLRRRNLLKPGLPNALGQVMQGYNGQAELCLQTVAERLGRNTTPTQPNRVRAQGIACFMKSPVMRTNAQRGAILRFNEDGTATLFTGAVEIGQGMSTIMTQIAAQALAMPVEMVHPSPGVDTQYSPYEWQTVASHTTWAVGNAVRMAAEDALAQIKRAGERIFSVPQDELVCEDGCVFPRGQAQRALTYAQIGVGFTRPDGKSVNPPVIGRATFVPTGLTFPDPATGQGNMAASWTFGCQGADVETQDATGPYGALGLGEHGFVAVPPAIANALSGALGVEFYETPISPDRVIEAINQKEGR